jgi:hypothetical protein
LFYITTHIDTRPQRVQLLKDANVAEKSEKGQSFLATQAVKGKKGKTYLQFVREMAVCSCHVLPEDVEPGVRRGSLRLKPTARLHSLKFLQEHAASSRPNPFVAGTGFNTTAQKFLEESQHYNARVLALEKEVQDLIAQRQHSATYISELEEEVNVLQTDLEAMEEKAETLAGHLSRAEKLVGLLELELREALGSLVASREEAWRAKEEARVLHVSMTADLQRLAGELEASRRADPSPTTPEVFARLRRAVYKAEKTPAFEFSLACVERVCKESGAHAELARVQAMLVKKRVQEGESGKPSATRLARAATAERRVVAAFFFDLGATSERFSVPAQGARQRA